MKLSDFVRASAHAGWSSSEDQVGFHMDVDAALSTEASSFRWDFEPADTTTSLVFEIEWIGEGTTISDIDRDFYRVCGRFTEESQYISRTIEADHVVYDVVAGTEKHGHVAKFKITGNRAATVTAKYAALVRANREARSRRSVR